MILSSKQLEELEHLHDSVSEFDEEANVSSDNEEFDEASEGALAWRRGMLERASTMVKKNDRKPLSSKDDYAIGALVYDTLNNRFARVKESSTSQVLLAYVSGGEGILKGSVIQITQVAKPSAVNTKKRPEPKKKAEPTAKKPAPKKPVAKKTVPKKPVALKKAPAKKPVAKKSVAKKAVVKKTAAKKVIAKKKTPIKKLASKKPAPKKKPVAKKVVPKKAAPKKKIPLKKVNSKKPADPNAFIKQNYRKMSNKELAGITGLSEHTIRRKLGEWGLKRPVR